MSEYHCLHYTERLFPYSHIPSIGTFFNLIAQKLQGEQYANRLLGCIYVYSLLPYIISSDPRVRSTSRVRAPLFCCY
jgi:hypothetical protein